MRHPKFYVQDHQLFLMLFQLNVIVLPVIQYTVLVDLFWVVTLQIHKQFLIFDIWNMAVHHRILPTVFWILEKCVCMCVCVCVCVCVCMFIRVGNTI